MSFPPYKKLLRLYECPQITYQDELFPLFISRAKGEKVWDVTQKVYIDFTSFFGASLLGHNDPFIQKKLSCQMKKLLHGMGDIHPPEIKALALQKIAHHLTLKNYKGILSLTGSEAVESLIKTVLMVTGKPKILCFEKSYHGLSLGALFVTSWQKFREPFLPWLQPQAALPFPETEKEAEKVLERTEKILKKDKNFGAILLEPVQGRGGIRFPPPGFLSELKELCARFSILFCTDEILTGFYRTGWPLYTLKEKVFPDLVAIGKAMGNGFPVSACFGKKELMDCWGFSEGEAIHTSTFLGHPLSCAAACAVCERQQELSLFSLVQEKEKEMSSLKELEHLPSLYEVKGEGLLWKMEIVKNKKTREPAPQKTAFVIKEGLKRGYILLSAAPEKNVLALMPPITIKKSQIEKLKEFLQEALCSSSSRA